MGLSIANNTAPRVIKLPVALPYLEVDGIVVYSYFSFGSCGDKTYYPSVDLDTGETWCDCPDTECRRNKNANDDGIEPYAWLGPYYICKHRRWLIAKLLFAGRLPKKWFIHENGKVSH